MKKTVIRIGSILVLLLATLGMAMPAGAVESTSSPATNLNNIAAVMPAVPVLLSPAKTALVMNYLPTLTWKAALNAKYYEVQIAKTSLFTAPLVLDKKLLTLATYKLTVALAANKTWYWRVRSTSSTNQTSVWSLVWSFRTVIGKPTLIAPVFNHITTLKPVFDWSDVVGASGYTIQISKNAGFTLLIGTYNTTASTYTPLANLPTGEFWWRVRTRAVNGPSNWSAIWKMVDKGPLGCTACH